MSQVLGNDTLQQWQETAAYWTKHHDTIRMMFAPLTRALIEHAHIVQGQSVLDVAGGAGEPSLTIAQAVGPLGFVMCTDPIAEMLASGEQEAVGRGLENVRFLPCTADSLPFKNDLFDVAVSRLGVMFFPEPLVGIREMLRVTKPGGRIAFAVWDRSEFNPYSYRVTQVVSRYIAATPVEPDAPEAFRFAEPGKLAAIVKDAGAINVDECVVKFDMTAPISTEEFWTFRSEVSDVFRAKLKSLSQDEKERIAREVQDAVREFFPDGYMRFPAQMMIVSGNKA
ncbi:MAG TPA: class I SAM-dependent methyltransferase [Pyrinomonadaceae bacterium]|nr:class I SAM-dependent methyltransferase [Pyrinomonadaceae bacterium]